MDKKTILQVAGKLHKRGQHAMARELEITVLSSLKRKIVASIDAPEAVSDTVNEYDPEAMLESVWKGRVDALVDSVVSAARSSRKQKFIPT